MLSRARIREFEIRERIAMIEKGLVPPPEKDPDGFDRVLGVVKGTAARGELGQSCAGPSCADPLRCIDGECQALGAPGAACASDFDCAAGGCVANANGSASCGPKCSISLAQLKESKAAGMRLPLRPRD